MDFIVWSRTSEIIFGLHSVWRNRFGCLSIFAKSACTRSSAKHQYIPVDTTICHLPSPPHLFICVPTFRRVTQNALAIIFARACVCACGWSTSSSATSCSSCIMSVMDPSYFFARKDYVPKRTKMKTICWIFNGIWFFRWLPFNNFKTTKIDANIVRTTYIHTGVGHRTLHAHCGRQDNPRTKRNGVPHSLSSQI